MRHGSTSLNDAKRPRMRAWKDVRLDDVGREDVKRTADKLKPLNPGHVYSSDLMRDAETAEIVATVLGVANENDFDARTWDMGTLEGNPLDEVNPTVEKLYQHPWETPPGSSESFNGFQKRWLDFLDRKMYLAANIPVMRPIVIVTHGKNIALAHSYIDGLLPEKAVMPLPARYAVIRVNQDRSLSIDMEGKTEPVIEDV